MCYCQNYIVNIDVTICRALVQDHTSYEGNLGLGRVGHSGECQQLCAELDSCDHWTWRPDEGHCYQTNGVAIQVLSYIRRFAKISESRRRPLIGPSPGLRNYL